MRFFPCLILICLHCPYGQLKPLPDKKKKTALSIFKALADDKILHKTLTLYQKSPFFTCMQFKSFENTVGKGEIARNE